MAKRKDASGDTGYLINFRVEVAEAKRDIGDFIDFLKDLENNPRKAGSHKGAQSRKKGKNVSPDDELVRLALKNLNNSTFVKKLKKLKAEITTQPSSRLSKIMRQARDDILNNIEVRASETFRSHRRYTGAIKDKRFSVLERTKSHIDLRIANTEVLDEWTRVEIDKWGGHYNPPNSYNYDSWWRWHEYEGGVSRKTTFRDRFAYFYVKNPPESLWSVGSNRKYKNLFGGFSELRQVFTLSNVLFQEDEMIRDNIPAEVQHMFVKAIK